MKTTHINDKNQDTPWILVIEDSLTLIAMLSQALKMWGYNVQAAATGYEGIGYAKTKPIPDLIILDVQIPDLDGYEVCKVLKNKNSPLTSTIPIIFLTGMHQEEKRRQGFDVGCDDYLVKPIQPEILRVTIERLLNKRKKDKKKLGQLKNEVLALLSRVSESVDALDRMIDFQIANKTFNPKEMQEQVKEVKLLLEQLADKGIENIMRRF